MRLRVLTAVATAMDIQECDRATELIEFDRGMNIQDTQGVGKICLLSIQSFDPKFGSGLTRVFLSYLEDRLKK